MKISSHIKNTLRIRAAQGLEAATAVEVSLNGATFLGLRMPDGELRVGVASVCEALGLVVDRQVRKLRDRKWAFLKQIRGVTQHVGGANIVRDLESIPLEALPLWLGTINASKVLPERRDALEAFQCEAARRLAVAFGVHPRQLVQPAALASEPEYVSVRDWAALRGKRLGGVEHATVLSMQAKQECLTRGVEVKRFPHEQFGTVLAYPVQLLDELFQTDE